MNQHTYKLLKTDLGPDWRPIDPKRAGVVWMDYPGDGLIDRVVMCNGLPPCGTNLPPEAVAGGPYVSEEGTEVVFDASGSSDADGDVLRYRWILEKPEVQPDSTGGTTTIAETDWSLDSTAAYTFCDDDLCFVRLQVTDDVAGHVSEAEDSVRIMNVAPVAAIDSLSSPVPDCILPGQEVVFHGSFTDPGCEDTHGGEWNFGDGTVIPATFAVEAAPPDASGYGFEAHVFGVPGIYPVTLTVEDDDGGVGSDNKLVKVMNAVEAVDCIDNYVQELPDVCFKRPADQRKGAIGNKLAAVKKELVKEAVVAAIEKLVSDLRSKMNGDGHGDWITDEEAQQRLCLMIDELVGYLEAPPVEGEGAEPRVASDAVRGPEPVIASRWGASRTSSA